MSSGYLVRWEVDSEADSPLQAAKEAWEWMRAPDSMANVFDVIDGESGEVHRIDLSEIEGKEA